MPLRSTPQDTSHEHPSHVHTHRPKPLSRTSSSLAAFVLTPLSSFSQTSQAFPQLKQSYENLVALANAREALRQTRREAVKHGKQVRKMVWRDRGEPPVELRSVEDCIEHAVRGGSRAGGLAFAIRSGVNFFLLLFRITHTPRKARTAFVLHALFGPDSFRFAAMLGTFVAVYKFLINSLPLVSLPADFSPPLLPRTWGEAGSLGDGGVGLWADEDAVTPPEWIAQDLANNSKKEKAGVAGENGTITMMPKVKTKLSAQAVAHEIWVRKKGRRWHAFVAGAVAGGVAILFETKKRRVGIAQQMFVRGLQGSYNALSERHGFTVPYGSVLVFSLCCGQIMYAWMMRPDTIPPSYVAWITQASKVGKGAVKVNKQLVREGVADRVVREETKKFMHDIVRIQTTTKWNIARLKDELSVIESSTGKAFIYPFASCAVIHPWVNGCWMAQLDKFWAVFKWMFPIYGALHFVPSLLFKHQTWFSQPRMMATRTLAGTARSSSFLGAFVVIYLSILCSRRNLYDFLRDSSRFPVPIPLPLIVSLRDLILRWPLYWVAGFCSGLSLFVEAERRRGELAMYVMPKALESLWVAAHGKASPSAKRQMMSEAAFLAAAMGMVMSTYQNDPQHLSGLVRRILYQFIGPN